MGLIETPYVLPCNLSYDIERVFSLLLSFFKVLDGCTSPFSLLAGFVLDASKSAFRCKLGESIRVPDFLLCTLSFAIGCGVIRFATGALATFKF